MTNLTEQYFCWKCWKGLQTRGLSDNQTYRNQMSKELDIIVSMGFSGYFLIVSDFINWAREQKIVVGPGRGSGVGSLAAFCLYITDVDPIKYNLSFDRFLIRERVSLPDFDIDFEKRYRNLVIDYIVQKYGKNKVAHIGTFNLQRAKAAVKNITKILGHPYAVGEDLVKHLLPPIHGKPQSLATSIQQVPALQKYMLQEGIEAEILKLAEQVENHIHSIGAHASGIAISNLPLDNTIPLFVSKDDSLVTQWEMNNIEEVGLVKFDFLGLETLDKIHQCADIVWRLHGIEIPTFSTVDTEDEATYKMLQSGNVTGCFQVECSQGIRDLLVQIKPTCIEDLSTLLAIYRPGPLSSPEVGKYLEVRAGKRNPEYLVPELEPILGKTQGLAIFQEQCAAVGSPIWGPNEVKVIEQIHPGDIISLKDHNALVINQQQTGHREVLRLTTSFGYLSVTPEHPVLARRLGEQEEQFRQAQELLPGDYIPIVDPRLQSPICESEIMPQNQLEEAYFLGILVGDGCLSKSTTICAGSNESTADFFIEKFKRFGTVFNKYFHTRAWYVTISTPKEAIVKGSPRTTLGHFLNKHGLWKATKQNKRIPPWVLSNRSLMAAFILGMIDTDGHQAEDKQSLCITSTVNYNLHQLRWMFHQLGMVTRLRENKVYYINPTNLLPIYQIVCPLKHIDFVYWEKHSLFGQTVGYMVEDIQKVIQAHYGSLKQYSRLIGISRTGLSTKNYNNKKNKAFFSETLIKKFPKNIQAEINTLPLYAILLSSETCRAIDVYDITVENDHIFNIDGHIVHNSMAIARQLCGYSAADTDDFRRAIGKKKLDAIAKHEPKFLKGWEENNLPIEAGRQIWSLLRENGNYQFNSSHSTAYAFITYLTAYLKTHWPTEYMCACMTLESDNRDQMIKLLTECKRLEISILPPDINKSGKTFWIDGPKSIRFGLGPIKNLGTGADVITEERDKNGPFKDIRDFCNRIDLSIINSRKLESLVLAGALDSFALTRTSLLRAIEQIWKYKKEMKQYESKLNTFNKKMSAYLDRQRELEARNTSEKGHLLKPKKLPEAPIQPVWPEMECLDEMSDLEVLKAEHELLGFYVTSHPLSNLRLVKQNFQTVEVIKDIPEKTIVQLAAVITQRQELATRVKKQKMAFLHLEDLTGDIEAVVFPHTFTRLDELLQKHTPLLFTAQVEITETEETKISKLVIQNAQEIPQLIIRQQNKISITVPMAKSKQLKELVEKCKGEDYEVHIIFKLEDGTLISGFSTSIGQYKTKFMREILELNG